MTNIFLGEFFNLVWLWELGACIENLAVVIFGGLVSSYIIYEIDMRI